MRTPPALLLLAAALGAAPAALAADGAQEVTLVDGQTLRGVVEAQADGSLVLVLADGTRLPLPAAAVASVGDLGGPAADRPPDANRSRYFYGPSAFPLGRHHGYLAQREIALSSVGFGVVEGWDLEAGAVLPTVFIQDAFVGFVGTKASFPVAGQVRAGLGGQVFFIPEAGQVVLGFGVVTVGDEDLHASIASGPGLIVRRERTWDARTGSEEVGGLSADLGVWITAVSGVKRLGPKAALVSENWILWIEDGGPWGDSPLFVVPSGGVRLLGPRYAIDLGLVPLIALDQEVPLVPAPWVSFDWAY